MQDSHFQESELIVNPDGSIYHLHLLPEQLADTVILVGDQDRVDVISQRFDTIECKVQSREFRTHTGTFKGKRISALSTGIGADNIDIVVNELDALANIDFAKRQRKPQHRKLNLVRLGTCGAIQQHIPAGAFVISEYAMGFDGLLHYYAHEQPAAHTALEDAFLAQTNWDHRHARPYAVKGSEALVQRIGEDMFKGVTATAPGFYGPQGRKLRVPLSNPAMNDSITAFEHDGLKIANYEMETSAIYALGGLLGHECCTVCTVIANRVNGQFDANYKQSVERMIDTVLDRLTD